MTLPRWVWWAGCVLLVAAVFDPIAMGRPLWLDEAISAVGATSETPWHALATTDLHPPGWMVITRTMALVAQDEAWLRLPALLAWLGTAAALWVAATTWDMPRMRWPLAIWAICAPHLVLYATELRPYALAACATAWTVALAPTDRWRPLTAAAVVATLAMYGAWPSVVIASALHAHRQDGPRRYVPVFSAVIVMVALALLLVPAQFAHQAAHLSDGHLAPWFWTWSDPLHAIWHQDLAAFGWYLTGAVPWMAPYVGVLAGFVLVARIRDVPDDLTLVTWGPAIGLFVLSGLDLYPYGPTRHLLPVVPGAALWMAYALRPLGDKAATLPLLLVPFGAVFAPQPTIEDVPAMLATLEDEPGVVVLDASVVPQARWLGNPAPALPWRRGEALQEALQTTLPDGDVWIVVGQSRRNVLPEIRRWAKRAKRKEVDLRHETGVIAVRFRARGIEP